MLSAVVVFTFGDLAHEPRHISEPLQDDLAGLFASIHQPCRVLYGLDNAPGIVFVVQWTTALTFTSPDRR